MKEPDLLQEQRLSLRQFRRAAADRTGAEQAIATRRAADQTIAKASFIAAQQQAKTLWERVSRSIQSAQEILGRVRLQEFLPKDIPAAALTLQPGEDPESQLDITVVEVERNLSRIRDDVTALKQWRQRKKTRKQVLAVAAIVVLLISAVALYNGYRAWKVSQLYRTAVMALESGQYTEAIGLFNELEDYNDSPTLLQESYYRMAVATLNGGEWEEARRLFNELGDYKDSQTLFQESTYRAALAALYTGKWEDVRRLSNELDGYKDDQTLLQESYYRPALAALYTGKWEEARRLFSELGNYKDSQSLLHQGIAYQQAIVALDSGEWEDARRLFNELGDYRDSQTLLRESYYQLTIAAMGAGHWEEARRLLSELDNYKDSQTLLRESYYQLAIANMEEGYWEEAHRLLSELGDYKDSQTLFQESYYQTAVAAMDAGAWEEARRLFSELGDYKDSPKLAFVVLCLPPASPVLGDTCTRRTDGMTMVYAPGGSFLMGSDPAQDVQAFGDEMPQHRVTLDGFWIDRTEVTNAQYEMCVAAGACASSDFARDADYNGAAYPVVGVSWHDAVDYCAWAGGQLPTEAQWEYAARGPKSFLYPWGNNPPTCSLAQFGGCNGDTAPVGSFSPDGDSWIGAADMAGNVGEWVAEWYNSDYYAVSPADNPTGPTSGDTKVLRGGSWYDNAQYARAASRIDLVSTVRFSSVSFRCAHYHESSLNATP